MSKSVKLVVSIYLAVVAIICCAYLVMLLVGSFQGNDMRGAVLDSDNTKNIENVDYINNSSQSSELKTTESRDIPQGSQSSNNYKLNNVSSLKDNQHHTWSLEQSL
ncbi:hypothetical protein ACWEYZ_05770 [Staphylococcus shinii]